MRINIETIVTAMFVASPFLPMRSYIPVDNKKPYNPRKFYNHRTKRNFRIRPVKKTRFYRPI